MHHDDDLDGVAGGTDEKCPRGKGKRSAEDWRSPGRQVARLAGCKLSAQDHEASGRSASRTSCFASFEAFRGFVFQTPLTTINSFKQTLVDRTKLDLAVLRF
jgi:hypothetical protein